MAKKSFFTRGGREFMVGAKASLTKRSIYGSADEPVELVTLSDGSILNIPESKIYRALEALKIDFDAQVSLGGGRALGGALADFIIPDSELVIEYQGPFHFTSEGKARDFWREVTRKQHGFQVAYIEEKDLIRLRKRLVEIIGAPSLAAMM